MIAEKNVEPAFLDAVSSLLEQRSLTRLQACDALGAIIDRPVTAEQVALFLTALKMKIESVDEILGFLDCLQHRSISVRLGRDDLIDVCGTGGDSSGSFNVSTTVSLVLAASGQCVVKHGNRSISSRSGSFDLIEELGIPFDSTPELVQNSIEQFGIAFLFAPAFHPALKSLGLIRKNLGVATVLNLLGPLLNPVVDIKRQIVGVYKKSLLENVASVLQSRGSIEALVVHGQDGLDELTLGSTSYVCHLKNGQIRSYELIPEDFGLTPAHKSALRGGSPRENAEILFRIFDGEVGPRRDVTLLNAAAALLVGGRARDFKEGVAQAQQAIDSGQAKTLLNRLREKPAK